MFTTFDHDNDQADPDYNCAPDRLGSWWFNNCFEVCLTCSGVYHEWYVLPGRYLSHSRMMIIPAPD